MSAIECGTAAGYRRHRRRGETACAECLAAEARRVKEYRDTHPGFDERRKAAQNRRRAAHDVMRKTWPGIYRLYHAAHADDGVTTAEVHRRAVVHMAREWPEHLAAAFRIVDQEVSQ